MTSVRTSSLHLSTLALAAAAFLVPACSSSEASGVPRCTPGYSMGCACADGRQGAQLCGADSTFGACSCAGSGAQGDAADGGRTSAEPGDTTTPGGPVFLSSGATVSQLTSGEAVTFTAVLTDPQGIDDLIGGSLKSPDGLTYGSFQTSAAEGSYSLRLTWDDIHRTKGITFTKDESRPFVAEFFDAAGHRATKTISIRLQCSGKGACDGTCVDLSQGRTTGTSRNVTDCGVCGHACGANEACREGTCMVVEG